MLRPIGSLVAALALTIVGPVVVRAQVFPFSGHHCCPSCQQAPAQCSCTRTRPVVGTTYRQEQFTTYRNVTDWKTERQQFTETVPVTKMRQVNVDRGQYKTVWVPKVVTEQVAETHYEQRIGYRNVQRPVTRRVAETRTRVVPQQTVRYQTEQYQTVMAPPTCNTCGVPATAARPYYGTMPAPMTAMAPSYPPPPVYTTMAPTAPVYTQAAPPRAAAIPSMPPINVRPRTAQSLPELSTIEPLVPEATSLDLPAADAQSPWTPVESRQPGLDNRQSSYDEIPLRTTSRAAGKFVPAPSAARVWQSQSVFR